MACSIPRVTHSSQQALFVIVITNYTGVHFRVPPSSYQDMLCCVFFSIHCHFFGASEFCFPSNKCHLVLKRFQVMKETILLIRSVVYTAT